MPTSSTDDMVSELSEYKKKVKKVIIVSTLLKVIIISFILFSNKINLRNDYGEADINIDTCSEEINAKISNGKSLVLGLSALVLYDIVIIYS